MKALGIFLVCFAVSGVAQTSATKTAVSSTSQQLASQTSHRVPNPTLPVNPGVPIGHGTGAIAFLCRGSNCKLTGQASAKATYGGTKREGKGIAVMTPVRAVAHSALLTPSLVSTPITGWYPYDPYAGLGFWDITGVPFGGWLDVPLNSITTQFANGQPQRLAMLDQSGTSDTNLCISSVMNSSLGDEYPRSICSQSTYMSNLPGRDVGNPSNVGPTDQGWYLPLGFSRNTYISSSGIKGSDGSYMIATGVGDTNFQDQSLEHKPGFLSTSDEGVHARRLVLQELNAYYGLVAASPTSSNGQVFLTATPQYNNTLIGTGHPVIDIDPTNGDVVSGTITSVASNNAIDNGFVDFGTYTVAQLDTAVPVSSSHGFLGAQTVLPVILDGHRVNANYYMPAASVAGLSTGDHVSLYGLHNEVGLVVSATISNALISGPGYDGILADWNVVTNGSITFHMDGSSQPLSGLNFSGASSLVGVASIIQTALAASSPGATVVYDGLQFIVTSGTSGTGSGAGFATAGGSGTDISSMLAMTSTTYSYADQRATVLSGTGMYGSHPAGEAFCVGGAAGRFIEQTPGSFNHYVENVLCAPDDGTGGGNTKTVWVGHQWAQGTQAFIGTGTFSIYHGAYMDDTADRRGTESGRGVVTGQYFSVSQSDWNWPSGDQIVNTNSISAAVDADYIGSVFNNPYSEHHLLDYSQGPVASYVGGSVIQSSNTAAYSQYTDQGGKGYADYLMARYGATAGIYFDNQPYAGFRLSNSTLGALLYVNSHQAGDPSSYYIFGDAINSGGGDYLLYDRAGHSFDFGGEAHNAYIAANGFCPNGSCGGVGQVLESGGTGAGDYFTSNLDGITLGATTPAPGNFTRITSQILATGASSNTDLAGIITLASGATSSSSYTFSGTYAGPPVCLVQAQNALPATLATMGQVAPQISTTGISVNVANAPGVSVNLGYICVVQH